MAVLQRRDQLFERGIGGTAVARVGIALLFAAEDAVELCHLVVEEGGGGVDRRGDRDGRGGLPAVAGVNGLGEEVHGCP